MTKNLFSFLSPKKTIHKKAIISVVTNNYFHQAAILAKSIALFEPEADYIVFVIGYDATDPDYTNAPFQVLDAKILNPKEWERFVFQYPSFALCCALKPQALKHTLRTYDKVIYLDTDIKLFNNLDQGWNALDGADLSLTPHRNRAPAYFSTLPSPLLQRLSGIFNAGYIGVSSTGKNFLEWWWDKTHYNCISDQMIGIYFDQLYLNEAIEVVDRLNIITDSGYNVAWWNLYQRKLKKEKNRYWVNDQSLSFFHFSNAQLLFGDVRGIASPTKYMGEVTIQLYQDYLHELSEAYTHMHPKIYPYATFEDGTPIPLEWREWMRRDYPEFKKITSPRALSLEERIEIFEKIRIHPENFCPNGEREVNDWRNNFLVETYTLKKVDQYIRFLEELLEDKKKN